MTTEASTELVISIEDATRADANRAAGELRDQIVRAAVAADAEIGVTLIRDRADTQDLGTVLEIVLAAPSVVVLAKAVHAYVAKRGNRVVIRTKGGEVVATGSAATNIDVAKTVEALRKRS